MAILSDIDDCKLEAIFPDKDEEQQVLHYEYYSDTSRVQRKARVEKRWIRQRCLGRGSYGDVWLEFLEDEPNMKRAVKAIRIKDVWSGVDVNYAREVRAMVEFSKAKYRQDGHFVHFLGWYDNTRTDTVFLAMEYFPLGDLDSHMVAPFAEDSVKVISSQVLHALATMHAEGFTHRDLKPANIFVVRTSPVWWIKLGDFGITKRVQSSATALRTMIGTHDYMAPEFFGYVEDQDEEDPEYTNAVDLWAVGCIVFKLFTQHVPFPSGETMWPLKKYCLRKSSAPQAVLRERGVGNTGVNFVLRLLEPQPSRRLTAEAALENPWLNSVDKDPAELNLVFRSSSTSSQEEALIGTSMVKNYGRKPMFTSGRQEANHTTPNAAKRTTLPPVHDKPLTQDESITLRPVSALERDLTIRWSKLTPNPRSINCPLSRACSRCGKNAFYTDEQLTFHLQNEHRDWEATYKDWKERGLIDERPSQPYDCPWAWTCSRNGRNGFGSEEEVLQHFVDQHKFKSPPKEGDILVPHFPMFNY